MGFAGALVTTEAEEIVDPPNEFMRTMTLQNSLRRSQGTRRDQRGETSILNSETIIYYARLWSSEILSDSQWTINRISRILIIEA